jgi:hypothetical protein
MKRYQIGNLRVPIVAIPFLAVLGLVGGGLFVLFLPLIGAAALVWYAARWTWQMLGEAGLDVAGLFSDHAFPGRSHFTGRDGSQRKAP